MLTLAIIGAAILTTTVIIFWNMTTEEDSSFPSSRGAVTQQGTKRPRKLASLRP